MTRSLCRCMAVSLMRRRCCVRAEEWICLIDTDKNARASDDDIPDGVSACAQHPHCSCSHSEWLGVVANSRCMAGHQSMR